MSAEKWTASWPQGWKASSPTSRGDSCTLGVTSEGGASGVFHARPRDFRKFTLTAYRFYLWCAPSSEGTETRARGFRSLREGVNPPHGWGTGQGERAHRERDPPL